MSFRLLIISADSELAPVLSALAEKQGVLSQRFASWSQFPVHISGTGLLLIDLDSVPTDNAQINNVKSENPEIQIVATSTERLHPHLSQSFQKNVLAMLNKPLDLEELQFWMRNATQRKKIRDPEPTA